MINLKGIDTRLLFILLGSIGVLWVLPIPGHPFYVLLALYCLRGPKETIQAFFLMFLLLLGNGAILPGGGKIMRWLVLFAGFFAVVPGAIGKWRQEGKTSWPVVLVAGFCLAIILISVGASKYPAISILKIVGLGAGSLAILMGFWQTAHLRDFWHRWFSTYSVLIIVASILILPLGYGFERNGMGFQGILSHPQVFGPVAACITAWLTGEYIRGRLFSRWMLLLVFLSWGCLYLSLSRTAFLAAAGGLVVARVIFFLQRRSMGLVPSVRKVSILLFFAGIIYVGLDYYRLQESLMGFTYKGASDVEVTNLFAQSRGWLVDRSMENFYDYPLLGIGLGVPSEYQDGLKNMEMVMGVPVSASVEKGFLPTAVLEEMGIFGASFTILLFLITTYFIARNGDFTTLWLFIAALLTNAGEAVFFSIGGQGFFIWLMVGFCYYRAASENWRPQIVSS